MSYSGALSGKSSYIPYGEINPDSFQDAVVYLNKGCNIISKKVVCT